MDSVEMVPLAAYESLATRLSRIIKYLIIGWTCSMFALGLILVISMSYTEQVVMDTVTQEADNYGSNTYAGGDYYDSEADDYAGYDYAEAGTDGSDF